MRAPRLLAWLAVPALVAAGPPTATHPALDPASWTAAPAAGVEMALAADAGPGGSPALRIDYDFHGHAGWVAARQPLDLELPAHYELRFVLRGSGPPNNLEVKLVDPSGDNVWWHVDRDREWPRQWTAERIRQRQVTFAWGPSGGNELRHVGALELAISASAGGRGSVWVAGLEIVPVEPPAATPGPLRAEGTSAAPGHPVAAAVDGDEHTSWRPTSSAVDGELRVDLGGLRELGGVTLVWEPTHAPRHFRLELSSDGREWGEGREVTLGGARRSHFRTPDAEARFLRIQLPADAGCPGICGLAEVRVRPLSFGAGDNDLFTALAGEEPRGTYPRGFSEETYWTVAGVAGDPQESLVSEDGAVELGERGFSLEPALFLGDRLRTWADVTATQALADGELPIPTVTWQVGAAAHALARLEVTALAAGSAGDSSLLVRYRLVNESGARLRGRLFVLARPFQVNPPYQFLNLAGGVAPLRRLACTADGLAAATRTPRREVPVRAAPAPDACGVLAFDEGRIQDLLANAEIPAAAAVEDPVGFPSAAMAWDVDTPAGGALDAVVAAPLSGDGGEALPALVAHGAAAFATLAQATAASWHQQLDRVGLDLPEVAAPLVRSLRANLGFVEIHRDGAALQPGSRAYARSWIRDGALTGAALLRLRHEQIVAAFAEWFAGYQYPDGKVPCCVDHRGADPVPENDSHGELIHLIAETYRFTRDRAFAQRLFPHVEGAVEAIEALRQERRTPEYETPAKLAFFGLLPESISHEGYSAKPVHSYWDDTFAYRGLDDAAALAAALGRADLATSWGARRDELRADLLASIARVRDQHRLTTLPASVELADFDSTSTTAMLDPGGLLPFLPADAVDATFERFWRELAARRDGSKEWDAYTPYEIRHVGSFVRLAVARRGGTAGGEGPDWEARAHQLLAWYLADQRPPGWNGWPEVVRRDYRQSGFLGDLPHGWVGSDFMRSLLDLFAFERADHALVLGAGVPVEWLVRPQGVAVRDLGTPWGPLGYTLTAQRGGYRFTVSGGLEVPPGGLVLVPPAPAPAQGALLDGRPVALAADGTVVVHQVPAVVDFLVASGGQERLDGR